MAEKYYSMMENYYQSNGRNHGYIHEITSLKMDLARAKNNLNIRTALELICDHFRERNKIKLAEEQIDLGKGHQAVLTVIVEGRFDEPTAPLGPRLFRDACATVIESLYPSGAGEAPVLKAVDNLYEHLQSSGLRPASQHSFGDLELDKTQHTTEQIAVMLAIVFFAHRNHLCSPDVSFVNGSGVQTCLYQLYITSWA
ncbi:hypothetical protein FB45DRAFT_1058513 [Roridomyces roridus]|uniref:Uncharacterized protein n=1 Tax=Roridomyces roridus TaxID=1738132 RepID=A0AAD7FNH5_9AGAR|nr:hypothetical protein FB45DRAFT_1058513 [Roridomyces roridus]